MSEPGWRQRAREYLLLMRIDRPIGALLLLWPTLWALWLAGEGDPNPFVVGIFIVGVFVMRSAGCVINDYADRRIDLHVERTRDRPLAAGRVQPREALALFGVLMLIALALVATLNLLTIQLAVIGAILAAAYPFMKRYTYLPQVHLGLAFSWAIPMAYAAQTQAVPPIAWLLVIGNVVWTVAYDTIYAMVDREDDLQVGVKSTAILFGELDRMFVAGMQLTVIVVMAMIARQISLGGYFATGLGLAAALFVYQQWLIRNRDRAGCFQAFLNNNWVGAAIFAGLVAHYL
ncbi:MAG: 4-hydroxybenzoate polyprenyltransferase [Gammaproteobacteria bacterium]|jgi:4-hydroxybenzoate polyprenyltransferase